MQLYTLDLHAIPLKGEINPKEIIFKYIDNFLTPLINKKNIQIDIIVGRGNNSNIYNFINGQPVTRYYTREYLKLINIKCKYSASSGKFSFYLI
ncbi:MAG: hypothetical protein ACRCXZ_00925 [Patescibacteria group bacterium]